MRTMRLGLLLTIAAFLLLQFDRAGRKRDRRLRLAPVALRPLLVRTGASQDEVIRVVDLAAAMYWKPVRCLQRSVCAVRLLRSIDRPAKLVVGYRIQPFMSHAWVTVDGQVVNDSSKYARMLRTLLVA